MSGDSTFVFILIAVAAVLMASNRVQFDIVALLVVLALMLSGVLTAGLGMVLSNTASAVLVAPIAMYTASALDVSPYPFAVAVLIAASAAYSTPVSTPVVTLVVDPGRYKFLDFVKVGMPLLFLTYLATLVVAPLVFPFNMS